MGHCLSRFRLLISYFKFPNFGCFSETDIISDDSLEAVREVVTALRSNVQIIGQGWIFRGETALQRGIVLEIVLAIEKGNLRHLRNLLDSGWRLEASQALYTFLTRLSQPLIPHSIQSLVLDDNGHVPVEIVATDVLGLMKQELSDRHFQLVSILLNLLDTVIKVSPADELRGNTLPISMLPFFFNIQSQHINEWRRIATIFVELIRLASQRIEAGHASNVRFRGDCNNLEVYERSNTNRILE
ncbi:unnamed protein product [Phaedon cochleariae]|uniref:Uncharacterized protein n=1 Tax=Phaedon cochleariae TaxID=80249 RepID=A0A9P0GTD5_PHACE|nr:unnamed protein product [Phaedon cochleariae]